MKPQDILRNFDIDTGRLIGIIECFTLVLEVLNKTTDGEDYLRDHREQLTDAVLKLHTAVFNAAQENAGKTS